MRLGRALILTMLAVGMTSAAVAAAPSTMPIGVVVSVEGNVYHAVPDDSKPRRLEPQDPVLAGEILETQLRSRTKILLYEDTLLTVAENSRIVLPSSHYDGEHGTQRTSVILERGQLRVLIGRPGGLHSTFEVQAGGGRIVAGYGYFTAWVHERPSFDADDAASPAQAAPIRSVGVANIGTQGEVFFSRSGQRETIPPGFFLDTKLKTHPRGPQPASNSEFVQRLIVATEMREPPREDNPKALLRALPADVGKPLASPGPIEAALVATGVIRALPANPYSPPAVISGAVGGSTQGATLTGAPPPVPNPAPAPISTPVPTAVAPPAPPPVAPSTPPAVAQPAPSTVTPPATPALAPPPVPSVKAPPPPPAPPPFPNIDVDDIGRLIDRVRGKGGGRD